MSVWRFGLRGPKGDPGTNGTNGTNGAAATIAVGTVSTGAPGSSATVVNAGSSSAAVFNFAIPRGDVGATGTPAISRAVRATTNASGVYTWTYATPFAPGVVPVIQAMAEGPNPAGTTVVNCQLVGTPTNTQCTIQVTRTAATVVALLGLTILSVGASVATVVHITASEPA